MQSYCQIPLYFCHKHTKLLYRQKEFNNFITFFDHVVLSKYWYFFSPIFFPQKNLEKWRTKSFLQGSNVQNFGNCSIVWHCSNSLLSWSSRIFAWTEASLSKRTKRSGKKTLQQHIMICRWWISYKSAFECLMHKNVWEKLLHLLKREREKCEVVLSWIIKLLNLFYLNLILIRQLKVQD